MHMGSRSRHKLHKGQQPTPTTSMSQLHTNMLNTTSPGVPPHLMHQHLRRLHIASSFFAGMHTHTMIATDLNKQQLQHPLLMHHHLRLLHAASSSAADLHIMIATATQSTAAPPDAQAPQAPAHC
jgi:hypothetical protein